MDYAVLIILFITGLILIVKGGDFFVDAAAWFAGVSGIPKFVVGATVVSFATTIPEMLVSVIATLQGKTDMAVGSAVGSVTANTGLILAISILFMPAAVSRRQILPKGLLLAGAMTLLLFGGKSGTLSQLEACLLLGIFAVFLIENVFSSKNALNAEEKIGYNKSDAKKKFAGFVIGAAAIFAGSELLVNTGSALAARLGISEGIIALTFVAFGTSLPELVTAVTALVKKEQALSVGNILGANILDAALIMPVCSFIANGRLTIDPRCVALDIPLSLVLLVLGILPPVFAKRFMRWQGAVMVIAYVLYIYKLFLTV